MIQEAHVGIGILGKEGSHAAMSSDYVLHRFAHLERLLFIHGRYNLNRTSKVIMLSLWKNFVFVLPVVWFAFSDLYSGQVMASSYFMSLYNLLFTSLQPLVLGIFDRDVDEVLLKRTPLAYRRSKEESRYTIPELLRWILCAAAQSAIVYSFVFYGIMKPELRSGDGKTFDLQASGNTLCWAVIVLVNCVMLAECDLISWINIVAWGLGILFFILAYMVLSLIYLESLSPETYGLLQFSYNDTLLWLVFLLTVLAMWAIWGAWKAFTRLVTPFYFQKLQAWELELPIITERKALPTWIARALFAGDLTAAKRDDGDEAAQAPSKSVLAAK
jgi:magnesium-transporting ATPase (P-type)